MGDFLFYIVLILCVYSIPLTVLIHHYFTGAQAMEVERLRQESISLRKNQKPNEWWQDVLVSISKDPTMFDKFMSIMPKSITDQISSLVMKR